MAPNMIILVATALIPIFLGMAWYHSSLFGTAWLKEMGMTQPIAAIPLDPTNLPTKMASIMELIDMIRKPIPAGTACLISSFPMGSSPRALECNMAGKVRNSGYFITIYCTHILMHGYKSF